MSKAVTRYWQGWLVSLVAVVFLAACGLEVGDPVFEDQTLENGGNGTDPTPGDELGGGQGAGTMTGTWLKLHLASSCVLNQEQLTWAYYLVDIEEDGVMLNEERRLCHLEMSPVLGFRPVASQAVLESIDFVILDQGYITSLLPGGSYVSATEVGLWGVDLEDPIGDTIPIDPEDEAVIDGDGDGNPGVSMKLEGSGCSRFMGQRQIISYFGTIMEPNDIRGSSATRTDIEVYGGTDTICELAPDVGPNDLHSIFRMVRVDGLGGAIDIADGDEITCDHVEPYMELMWEEREPDRDNCR